MSLDSFATNVTSLAGLADLLIQVAQIELGTAVDSAEIDKRANQLLVETMMCVGIDPKSEQMKRELIFRALRGSVIRDDQAMQVIEYLLGQMIAKPKGALGERLARLPCTAKIQELKLIGDLPPETRYVASTWSKRISPTVDDKTTRFSDWRDGADGVVYSHVGPHSVRHFITGAPLKLVANAAFILGVVEVKACRTLPKGEPKRQLDKHLARLTQGMQTRIKGIIETHLEPEQIYFARWRSGH